MDTGANINAAGEDRDTALHRAVAVEALDMVHCSSNEAPRSRWPMPMAIRPGLC